tara:strand:+ start:283 stop:636 length:354 start_codon:yes stop_codon:yes gene_type:complete
VLYSHPIGSAGADHNRRGNGMLFHITHHHDETTCPAHDEAAVADTFGAILDTLTENVNEVIGAWVDPPGHDFFMVVDADDASQIFMGLFPIVSAGTAKVQPVGDYVAMMKIREQLNS